MSYIVEIKPSCQNDIQKLCKRNAELKKALENKMRQIIVDPCHYKPLRNELAGERRVHIMKSFVLKFEIDEQNKILTFIFFGHHDEAYRQR